MKSTNNLAKQGIFLLAATTITNATNFLFNIIIGRLLGPTEYSILIALLSLLVIISVPTQTIQTVITKYSATFKSKEDYEHISYLFTESLKRLTFFGMIGFLFFLAASKPIAKFLNIPTLTPIFVLGLTFGIALVAPVGRGILQGLQSFNQFAINSIIEAFLRLLLGIGLVLLGLKASGALAASSISAIIAIFLIFVPLKFLFNKKGKPVDFNSSEMYNYFWPVLITLFCLAALTFMDIIIVKHFFSPKQAGIYAAASQMGRIVLFFPAALSMVMFSKSAELHAQNSETIHILKTTLFFVGALCVVLTIGYFVFPQFIITLIYGSDYLLSAPLMGPFGIAMTLFALINILIFHNLSIHNFKFIPFLIASTILQIVLLYTIPLTPIHVIYILIANASLLLIVNLFGSLVPRRPIERIQGQNIGNNPSF